MADGMPNSLQSMVVCTHKLLHEFICRIDRGSSKIINEQKEKRQKHTTVGIR